MLTLALRNRSTKEQSRRRLQEVSPCRNHLLVESPTSAIQSGVLDRDALHRVSSTARAIGVIHSLPRMAAAEKLRVAVHHSSGSVCAYVTLVSTDSMMAIRQWLDERDSRCFPMNRVSARHGIADCTTPLFSVFREGAVPEASQSRCRVRSIEAHEQVRHLKCVDGNRIASADF